MSRRYDVVIQTTRTRREDGSSKTYTEYQVAVQTRAGQRWTVGRRFREFRELYLSLQSGVDVFAVKGVAFPSRQLFGSEDPETVEMRRLELQTFLRHVVASPVDLTPLKAFLELDRERDPATKRRLRVASAPVPGNLLTAVRGGGVEMRRPQSSRDGGDGAAVRRPLLLDAADDEPSPLGDAEDAARVAAEVDTKLADIYDIMDRSQLTQSQEQRLHLYLGNITQLRARLASLIEATMDDDEALMRYLGLLERLDATIELYGLAEGPVEESWDAIELDAGDARVDSLRLSQVLGESSVDEEEGEEMEVYERLPPGRTFFCPICCDDMDSSSDAAIQLTCHADALYCVECLEGYAESKVQSADVVSVACPDPACDGELSPALMQHLLSDTSFEQYQQFRFLASLRDEPNCRWCPRAGCETPIIVDPFGPEQPQVSCPTCPCRFCFLCGAEWHPDATCAEDRRQRLKSGEISKRNEEAFAKYKKNNKTLGCPGCGADVQKIEGCNHMTCTCGTEFCWVCGDKMQWDHFQSGPCQGKQFTHHPRATTVGVYALVVGGVVVGLPLAIAGSAVALGLALPALAVGAPIYGGYRLVKRMQGPREYEPIEYEPLLDDTYEEYRTAPLGRSDEYQQIPDEAAPSRYSLDRSEQDVLAILAEQRRMMQEMGEQLRIRRVHSDSYLDL